MCCENALINAYVSLRWWSYLLGSFNPEDHLVLTFSVKTQGDHGLSDSITILELLEQNTTI